MNATSFKPMTHGELRPGDLIVNIDAPGTQVEMVLSVVPYAQYDRHVTITFMFMFATNYDVMGYGMKQTRTIASDKFKNEPITPCCKVYRDGVLIQDVDHEFWEVQCP